MDQVTGSHRSGAGTRHWAINGDFLGLDPTGVPRHAREVTHALCALVTEGHPLTRDLELTLICPRPPDAAFSPLKIKVVPEYARPRLPQLWVQAQLPRHVQGGLLSFCNLAPLALKRQIVCIHDLQTRLAPESYGVLFRLAHALILPALGRRASAIATVSRTSRGQIVQHGIAPAARVHVVHNGCDHALRWRAEDSALQPAPERPFVLSIGRREAHKNADLLFRLAHPLNALGIDLFMAGDAELARGARNIRSLGRISDGGLAAALAQAVCFLLPSRMEGFGLPALEAMARGCPVVASTAPSLPEVCGEAALYAHPDDPDAWISAIMLLMSDDNLRSRLIAAGRTRATAFSWRAVALRYLSLMAGLDGLPVEGETMLSVG